MEWTHELVFRALVDLKHWNTLGRPNPQTGKPYVDNYVVLYERHEPRCAVLYDSDSRNYGSSPLHLNDSAESWKPTIFGKIEKVIERRGERDQRGWRHYHVPDDAWNHLAEALNL